MPVPGGECPKDSSRTLTRQLSHNIAVESSIRGGLLDGRQSAPEKRGGGG